MATIPPQYLNNEYNREDANLSPLQLAAAYYMDTGQQIPFFINYDFLRELKVYADSGYITPADLGYPGPENISVVAQGQDIYILRQAADCGPDGINRTELVFVGNLTNIPIDNVWTFGGMTVRGGSLASGGGGPYGTGGVLNATGAPDNALFTSNLVPTANVYNTTTNTTYNGIA